MQTQIPFGTLNLSRATDPTESHRAAAEITADGTRSRMLLAAVEAVKNSPGLTANELEERHGYRDGQLRKRLKEAEERKLVKRGPSKRSAVTGKLNVTWEPT